MQQDSFAMNIRCGSFVVTLSLSGYAAYRMGIFVGLGVLIITGAVGYGIVRGKHLFC